MVSTKFRVNWLSVLEKKCKIDFLDGDHGANLGLPIEKILAIYCLQVTLMLPTKLQVSWPFGSVEEAKNRFSKWRPSWIFDWDYFSFFFFIY